MEALKAQERIMRTKIKIGFETVTLRAGRDLDEGFYREGRIPRRECWSSGTRYE